MAISLPFKIPREAQGDKPTSTQAALPNRSFQAALKWLFLFGNGIQVIEKAGKSGGLDSAVLCAGSPGVKLRRIFKNPTRMAGYSLAEKGSRASLEKSIITFLVARNS